MHKNKRSCNTTFIGSEKNNSEAFPLIRTRATRCDPPEGLNYPNIKLPKNKKKHNNFEKLLVMVGNI